MWYHVRIVHLNIQSTSIAYLYAWLWKFSQHVNSCCSSKQMFISSSKLAQDHVRKTNHPTKWAYFGTFTEYCLNDFHVFSNVHQHLPPVVYSQNVFIIFTYIISFSHRLQITLATTTHGLCPFYECEPWFLCIRSLKRRDCVWPCKG